MPRYWTDEVCYSTLQEALASRNVEVLRELTKLFGKKKAMRKADLIAFIENTLAGEGLRQLYESLDKLSKAAVAEVTHGIGTRLHLNRFVAKYGAPPRRHHEEYRDRKKSVPWTFLDIIFTNDVMPNDLKERFHAFVPPPEASTIKTVDVLPEAVNLPRRSWRNDSAAQQCPLEICKTEAAALHDLMAVLRLIDAGKISISAATRRPTLASAKAILGILRDGDFAPAEKARKAEDYIRAFAWPLLVQSAGLARLSGSKLNLSKAGRDALSRPAHETIKHLWGRWLDKGLVDEFSRVEAIKGQKRKGRGGFTDVAQRRVAVEQMLAACPPRKWIEIEEFFRYVEASDVQLEVVGNLWRLYLADPQYGSLGYAGYGNWSVVQGRYIMALLWEYAATLGMVDIAHVPPENARDDYWENWGADDLDCLSRYDGLKYFRITALGAYCLDITEDYAEEAREAHPVLRILPNRDVVISAPSEFSMADALFLDRIAAKSGDHTWALDKMCILDALESGIHAEEIFGFLDSKSQSPMPANIRLFINETIQRASLVSYEGTAEVFRVADEPTALLIAHDSAAKSLCYTAGGNRLIVLSRNVTAFRRVLRQLGFIAASATRE